METILQRMRMQVTGIVQELDLLEKAWEEWKEPEKAIQWYRKEIAELNHMLEERDLEIRFLNKKLSTLEHKPLF